MLTTAKARITGPECAMLVGGGGGEGRLLRRKVG